MPSTRLPVLSRWLLSSPPVERLLSSFRDLLIAALRLGPIPAHIAFVMDGNRRYAWQRGLEAVEGHALGFEALARALELCYRTGVTHVTVYAFSVENFKRGRGEVDALMDMARVKLAQLAQHGALLDRYGACVRVLGQRELVRPDVLAAMDEAVRLTRHNNQAVLNVCFPYTSREEMTTAIRTTVADYCRPLRPAAPPARPFSASHIAQTLRARRLSTLAEESSDADDTAAASIALTSAVDSQTYPHSSSPTSSSSPSVSSLTLTHSPPSPANTAPVRHFPDPETITAATLDAHMFTAASPPLDLLVRTSGVARLSDFLLWQCHEATSIVFVACLWPEFGLAWFLPVLLEWQWRRRRAEEDGRVAPASASAGAVASVGAGLGVDVHAAASASEMQLRKEQ